MDHCTAGKGVGGLAYFLIGSVEAQHPVAAYAIWYHTPAALIYQEGSSSALYHACRRSEAAR